MTRHHQLIAQLIAELREARLLLDDANERAEGAEYAANESARAAEKSRAAARRSAQEAQDAENRRQDEESNREDATRQLKRARDHGDTYGEAKALKKLERGW